MERSRLATLLFLMMLVGLARCATVHQTYAPDGRKAYTLNCSGLARGWDKCFAAAGELCGTSGYDVIGRDGEPISIAGFGANGSGASSFAGSTFERSMEVACKPR